MMKVNCWDYMGCGRELSGPKVKELGVCPVVRYTAFHKVNGGYNGGRYCWAVVGTFPKGEIQCPLAEELKDCRKCDFFQLVKQEQGDQFVL